MWVLCRVFQVHLEDPHFGEQMERKERYEKNLAALRESHMSQEMLLQLVQARVVRHETNRVPFFSLSLFLSVNV